MEHNDKSISDVNLENSAEHLIQPRLRAPTPDYRPASLKSVWNITAFSS
jgi:hypothetical protein